MPKFRVVFSQGYVVEAKDKDEAIKKAEELLNETYDRADSLFDVFGVEAKKEP